MERLIESDEIGLLAFALVGASDSIATQWGFTYLGRYYAYLSARNSRYDECSPGRLHLGMVVEACGKRGIEVLELMAPPSDYKLTWTDQTKQLSVFVMPFNLKGYWILSMLSARIIPAIQYASRLLPQAARRRLVKFLNVGSRAPRV
jgi:CelD/BcsL family acetyltransferase involved in cellulose biosynthesis